MFGFHLIQFNLFSIFCFIVQAVWLGLKAFLVTLECRSGSYTSTIRFLKNEIHTVEIKLSGLESEYESHDAILQIDSTTSLHQIIS